MNIVLKKLTPERLEDYLHYFETDAFSDHEEWAGCYCLESHLNQEEHEKYHGINRRNKVIELIQAGIMNGYLLYDDEKVVGWCNTDDKTNYSPIVENPDFLTEPNEYGKIKVLYCMDIAPEYRGKGLANLCVEQVCKNAKEEGYLYVEGYPFLDKALPYQYRGPIRLYENHGFTMIKESNWFGIMRKKL